MSTFIRKDGRNTAEAKTDMHNVKAIKNTNSYR